MSKRVEKAKTKMTRGRYPVAIGDVSTKMRVADSGMWEELEESMFANAKGGVK